MTQIKTRFSMHWHPKTGPIRDYGDSRKTYSSLEEIVADVTEWYDTNNARRPIFRLDG